MTSTNKSPAACTACVIEAARLAKKVEGKTRQAKILCGSSGKCCQRSFTRCRILYGSVETRHASADERVVIDGGMPEFQTAPSAAWQPFPDGASGEYVSTQIFKNIRDVVGLFGDSNVGLQTYWHADDLRAANEMWIVDKQTKAIDPVYCGPGLWYNKQTGRIHARLAHTHIDNPEVANYVGATDPRKLPLVMAPFKSVPLFVDQAELVMDYLIFRPSTRPGTTVFRPAW